MATTKKLPSLPEPEPWKLGQATVQWLLQHTPGAHSGSDCWGQGSATLHVTLVDMPKAVRFLKRFDKWLKIEKVVWILDQPSYTYGDRCDVYVSGHEPELPQATVRA